MEDFTTLQVLWFVLISVLWIGYFILEGFDFGVGILMKLLGRNEAEKRAILHSIGPLWDGNEVWLIVAGGATFAAFPEWYATLFSGFYLALFVILVALIVRNVGFEFWGKGTTSRWRNGWEWCIAIGSAVPALLWGVAWANIIGGTPIDSDAEFIGNFFDLLSPYALFAGLASLSIFFAHGALFLELKTEGEIRTRAQAVAVRAMPVATILAGGFLIWTLARQDTLNVLTLITALAATGCFLLASAYARSKPARAFAGTAAGIALYFTTQFIDLFPNTMISSLNSAYDMTLNFSSSSNYTLVVMTVVAVLLIPLVLLYQGWTYWVFRARLSSEDFGDIKTPLDLIDARKKEGDDGTSSDTGTGRKPTGS
ncbi:MAG: cytochrome d ubiquinol oxidase subunit II [Solirubrobacterales bacterium]